MILLKLLQIDISVLNWEGEGVFYVMNSIDYNEICVQHIWLFVLDIINEYLKKLIKTINK